MAQAESPWTVNNMYEGREKREKNIQVTIDTHRVSDRRHTSSDLSFECFKTNGVGRLETLVKLLPGGLRGHTKYSRSRSSGSCRRCRQNVMSKRCTSG